MNMLNLSLDKIEIAYVKVLPSEGTGYTRNTSLFECLIRLLSDRSLSTDEKLV